MEFVVVVIVILGILVLVLKKIDSFVYYLAIIDIFLRILDYVANNIKLGDFSNFINNYFPDSIFSIVSSYTDGIFTTVLNWILVILYGLFLVRITNTFFKKR